MAWTDIFKLFWYACMSDPSKHNKGFMGGCESIPDLRKDWSVIERPKCGNCQGPLDFFPNPDTGRYGWHCNNLEGKHTPIMDDEEFKRRWELLPGDDIVKLTREAWKG